MCMTQKVVRTVFSALQSKILIVKTFLQHHYQTANLNKNKLDTQENKCIFIHTLTTLCFLSISVSGMILILSTSVTFMIGIQNQMVTRLPHGQADQLQILPFLLPIRNLL